MTEQQLLIAAFGEMGLIIAEHLKPGPRKLGRNDRHVDRGAGQRRLGPRHRAAREGPRVAGREVSWASRYPRCPQTLKESPLYLRRIWSRM